MQAQTFTAGRHNYTIFYAKGKVVGKDKNYETKISGSGGGGASYQGTGGTSPISISSTTVIHDKVYLQQKDGKEMAIELTNWDIACREDHLLLVVWIKRGINESGPYVAIKNFTTDTIDYNKDKIKVLANQHIISGCLLISFIVLAGCVLLYFIMGWKGIILGIIALGIYEMVVSKKNKKAAAIIRKELDQFIGTEVA